MLNVAQKRGLSHQHLRAALAVLINHDREIVRLVCPLSPIRRRN